LVKQDSGVGRWNVDHGLVGFDLHQWLVETHGIADGDMPGDDHRFGEAFADVG
jgi:hypothetical protein